MNYLCDLRFLMNKPENRKLNGLVFKFSRFHVFFSLCLCAIATLRYILSLLV